MDVHSCTKRMFVCVQAGMQVRMNVDAINNRRFAVQAVRAASCAIDICNVTTCMKARLCNSHTQHSGRMV